MDHITTSDICSRIACPKCHQEFSCHGRNPRNVIAGHLTHCQKSKQVQSVCLINYDDVYSKYNYDSDSETESIIYPVEISNQDIFSGSAGFVFDPTYFHRQNDLISQIYHDLLQSRIVDTLGTVGQGNLMDYIEIHCFMTRTGMSIHEGNEFLSVFRKIAKRQKFKLCLPSNMRTVHNAINQNTNVSKLLKTYYLKEFWRWKCYRNDKFIDF
jgi:hypothetical protein